MIEIKAYSGHIRNHKALCKELGIECGQPRENREREIIVNGYKKWGCELPCHIYGMFAFVLCDTDNDTFILFRDQFGTVPMYYCETDDGRLLFGTQIRDIMKDASFKKELNEKMLGIYLTMTYTTGEETFFKGVMKLLPGRYMTWKKGSKEIVRYWKPTFNPDNSKTLDEWAEELHETVKLIMTEVKDEDETVESFLSGGVDSSYVLAMSDAKACDSVGYNDERLDESRIAVKTAEILGRKFNRCLVEPEDYFGAVRYVMENMEQPLGDASAVAFALGCKATAKGTKICYSGEGADEFFGGYNMYRNAERYGDNLKTFYVGNTNIMKEEEKQKILKNYNPDFLPIDLVKSIYEEN